MTSFEDGRVENGKGGRVPPSATSKTSSPESIRKVTAPLDGCSVTDRQKNIAVL